MLYAGRVFSSACACIPSASKMSTRLQSAWINKARADADSTLSSKTLDVERLFTADEVQRLLADVVGMDLERKVFKPRRTIRQMREHYALMTDERLEKTMDRMREEARRFLQPVPLKEPRTTEVSILAKDDEIAGFDQSRFVFTDITFDATDQDRTVVVRETDGTLRTATPEEHDRMNRVYYEKKERPVDEPPVFSDPYLQSALDRDEHEFVLDWACWFFEPDDPAFIKLSLTVFDRVVDSGKFDVLHSTRHFATLAFYLALNGNIPPMLNYFGSQGRLYEAANLIRLQKTLHPNWRVTISSVDSDLKICEDFIRQNERFKPKLGDLITYLKTGKVKSPRVPEGADMADIDERKQLAKVTASSLGSARGPLGEMSEEYNVKVAVATESEPANVKGKERRGRGRRKGDGEQ